MEKAKEIFAKADSVGIEESEGSGVVEPRMLRASEVRELMGEEAVIPQETAPPAPAPDTSVTTPASTPPQQHLKPHLHRQLQTNLKPL